MSTSRVVTALASAARTVTGTIDLGAIPGDYQELTVYIDVTAVGGTPSMTSTYQSSPDGVTFYDQTAGAALTAVSRQAIRVAANAGVFGRVAYTISGAAASLTFTVVVEYKRP